MVCFWNIMFCSLSIGVLLRQVITLCLHVIFTLIQWTKIKETKIYQIDKHELPRSRQYSISCLSSWTPVILTWEPLIFQNFQIYTRSMYVISGCMWGTRSKLANHWLCLHKRLLSVLGTRVKSTLKQLDSSWSKLILTQKGMLLI